MLAVFLAVSSIVATVVTLRYEAFVLLPKTEDAAASLAALSFLLVISLGCFLGVLAWLIPEDVRAILGGAVLGRWLPLAVLVGMATAVIAIGVGVLNRKRAYRQMVYLRIAQAVLGASIGIGLGLYSYQAGMLVAQIFSTLVIAIGLVSALPNSYLKWNLKNIMQVAKLHRSAPRYIFPAAVLDVVTMQLPVFLMIAWFGREEAGQFSMAWRMLALPISLVGTAVGQVFLQRFSNLWPDGLGRAAIIAANMGWDGVDWCVARHSCDVVRRTVVRLGFWRFLA